jgi:hypothetical protein
LVRSITTVEPEWTDEDRGLLIAWLAEQAEICDMCGHPMSICRDRKTAGLWTVERKVCWPSVVAQVEMENDQKAGKRGVVYSTRRS